MDIEIIVPPLVVGEDQGAPAGCRWPEPKICYGQRVPVVHFSSRAREGAGQQFVCLLVDIPSAGLAGKQQAEHQSLGES